MSVNQIIWTRYKLQCRFCAFNQLRPICMHSSNYNPIAQHFIFSHNRVCMPKSNLSLVKQVLLRLSYSTDMPKLTNIVSKKNESLEKSEPQSKKKKEIKVYITLLGSDGNMISVTTVEEASKLASRRNMRLVKTADFDPKTGRAVYKLMSESDYLQGDVGWEDAKSKKEKDKSIKGNKVVSLSSSTAEHDLLTKVKMMQKWLEKRFEVRVVISGDLQKGEYVYKILEKEIGTSARIVQKRSKGQDIRFQILPPKRTEGTSNVKDEK